MDKIPMTVFGAEALREELTLLKGKERPRIIKEIAEARDQGDLKENAEYHAAREEQSFIEGRIGDIESKLSSAQVIDITKIPPSGTVIFGTTIGLINLDSDEQVCYQIVGDDEADLKEGKISIHSPVARALIGKELGDMAVVKAPNGEIEYEIQSIEHLVPGS
ncbi:MAG: transcription elongation factor GreA [Pseudomonadales bacterium]|jgi:transcription elongation factor GreA|nr:transcription elongation factor GreA [Pseudomonadales bacterium]MDP7359585.1 transcription elongation factor GreA [Pseudomonadales bacterium]MDP7595814.1 transcription elongation factor GreA [Pseudomonadales bacterium]HJN49954.1 transcription elongation factor GreA [Pseudomonadales bacterium]|tara:strand:+ start:296 stop:784 length:489 start_codon:yes stop_codon:yes gene_type:complete